MKNLAFFRFLSHHRVLGTALLTILLFLLGSALLVINQAEPFSYILFAFLSFLFCHLLCKASANPLILHATKELQEKCDPQPLLRETVDALKYTKKGINRQIFMIDYATALGALGELEFAYRQLSEINIDKHAGMLPVVKIVYYNNMGYYAHLLGKEDAADLLHNKALAIYNTLKEGKQKDQLKFTMLSAQASACLRAGDTVSALSYASRMTPPNKYGEIETAWLLAEIYLAQKDTLSAKIHLERVASANPSLYIVKEAKRLLSEMN